MSILFFLLALANLIQWQFGDSWRVRSIAAAPVIACFGWYWLGGGRGTGLDEPLWVFAAAGLAYFATLGLLAAQRHQRDGTAANATAD